MQNGGGEIRTLGTSRLMRGLRWSETPRLPPQSWWSVGWSRGGPHGGRWTGPAAWEAGPVMISTTRDEAAPLRGRAREQSLLTSLLDGVGDRGQALVLRGEPGIGKSRLLSVVTQT